MNNKLTVVIPCKDERRNIRPCIESARSVADEILVCDSGSTDGTLQIVEQIGGCRIIERDYENPSSFKNWAVAHARHPWVYVLDADERITPALAIEIQELLRGRPTCDAYSVPSINYFMGNMVRYSGWQDSAPIRLFRREVCQYDQRRVHEHLVVATGKKGKLKQRALHFTCWSFDQYSVKNARYTELGARDLYDKGRRASITNLALRPMIRFCRHYFLKRGFLDGRLGLILSLLGAYSVLLRYARLWAIQYGQPQPDLEAVPAAGVKADSDAARAA